MSFVGQWFDDLSLADLSADQRLHLARQLGQWAFKPGGTEGYRTAEVTLGGISTDEFSSKTFEAKRYPGVVRHWRSTGCYRLVGWLQLPVGVGQRLLLRSASLSVTHSKQPFKAKKQPLVASSDDSPGHLARVGG